VVKEGLLAKNGLHNSQNITYSKTPMFIEKFQASPIVKSQRHDLKSSIADIKQKLVSYKVDLSASIA